MPRLNRLFLLIVICYFYTSLKNPQVTSSFENSYLGIMNIYSPENQ
jgi:hypothetical protein